MFSIDITGFIGECLYVATFMVWEGEESIDYSDNNQSHFNMSIIEFEAILEQCNQKLTN